MMCTVVERVTALLLLMIFITCSTTRERIMSEPNDDMHEPRDDEYHELTALDALSQERNTLSSVCGYDCVVSLKIV